MKLFKKLKNPLSKISIQGILIYIITQLRNLVWQVFIITVGILIAICFDKNEENNKKSELKKTYIISLIRDLCEDSEMFTRNIQILSESKNKTDDILNRIYSPSSNLDTLIKIARFEYNTGFQVINEYNTNSLDALIATGNLKLFEEDEEITAGLTELRRLHSSELRSFTMNRSLYFDRLNTYAESFSYRGYYYSNYHKLGTNSPIDSSMWNNINKGSFIPKFTNLVLGKNWGEIRLLGFNDTLKLKTDKLILRLNNLQKFEGYKMTICENKRPTEDL